MDLNKKNWDLTSRKYEISPAEKRGKREYNWSVTDTTAQPSYVNIIHKEARSILEEVSNTPINMAFEFFLHNSNKLINSNKLVCQDSWSLKPPLADRPAWDWGKFCTIWGRFRHGGTTDRTDSNTTVSNNRMSKQQNTSSKRSTYGDGSKPGYLVNPK